MVWFAFVFLEMEDAKHQQQRTVKCNETLKSHAKTLWLHCKSQTDQRETPDHVNSG